ncbi:MAG: hypothetical protein RR555_05565 [Bacteroidales bacterium]
MAYFAENNIPYDWTHGVYIIACTDLVEGGENGVSNKQGKELALRTRDLHMRTLELERVIPIKAEATLRSANEYTDGEVSIESSARITADAQTLTSAKDFATRLVDALVDAAPGALDTLKELAIALGNDPNFSTTILNELAKKVENTDSRLTNAREAVGGWSNQINNQRDSSKLKIWFGTQSQYNAISKQSDTLYFIQ